ncbi:MAG: BON domain-containing protein [Planctomycetia bacterium]|nr:BON domain-containing protein [Planctomycetia bacterium]
MTEAIARQRFEPNSISSSYGEDAREIESAIQDALILTGYGELRNLQVKFCAEAVTISGRVPTYYLKQLAQCVAQDVPGIGRVHNEIHVC